MNLRKFLYLIISVVLLFGVADYSFTVDARRSKARTAQSSSKKKKSKNKKSDKKNKKNKRSNKKSSKKSSRRSSSRRATPRAYTPPKEQPSNDSLTLAVNKALIDRIPENQNPGGLRVNSVKTDSRSRTARLSLNENFTYLPVTQDLIRDLTRTAGRALPDSIRDYTVTLNVGSRPLSYYISKIDKLPAEFQKNTPFVVAASPWVNPKKGMEGDIVALWHSHGRYFRPGSGWQWQRPMLWQTMEDVYTMTYILPYVVPMLENAGAYVMLPRERDINPHEVIVDNDTNEGGQIFSQPYYKEKSGSKKWEFGEGEGFIYDLPDFRDTENPFENGTYRQTTTIKSGTPSVAAWYADIPEDGEYAVYVSYKSLPNSVEDAHYTVNYDGGSREFRVNQTMGGSTWIYLGTFPLTAGYSETEPVVTLTNLTNGKAGTVVTADAVKIGGGMGNIARSNSRSDIYYDPSTPEPAVAQDTPDKKVAQGDTPDDEDADDDEDDDDDEDENDEGDESLNEDESPDKEDISIPATPIAPPKKGNEPVFRTSGLPRYLEGARYWLQWAGIPESVYSPYHGRDDYKDDYTDRGMWVNYLAGGSRVLPKREGLGIPVDVSMALHTDAGKRSDDSYVGTLGIYYTDGGRSYADGTPRMNSRMLTDMLMRQITGDIRKSYEPRWTRRSMWDKSYLEARVAEVPTALIELLSHQNFGDMQYGLDPGFRFTVGRAIYKALGRFISERKNREFVVQPLPASNFAITRVKKGQYRLSWSATPDSLEPTAHPSKYIILERTGSDLGFHKMAETEKTHYDFKIGDNEIHSFRVVCANEGGLSFPSETLALREGTSNASPVLIVNGFSRISAPEHFSDNGRAGFNSEEDFGVPYIREIGFTGYQNEYRRSAGDGFGRSSGNYIGKVIAGNTFDYPIVHGRAVTANGFGFISCSAGAVENGSVKLSDYKIVDWILGKQKTTIVGRGHSGVKFQTFSPKLMQLLRTYTDKGGNLIVSGQYVGSDLLDYRLGNTGVDFAADVLGIEAVEDAHKPTRGSVDVVPNSGLRLSDKTIAYSNNLNNRQYIVEHPDAIQATDNGKTFLTFGDTGEAAGIISQRGKSHVAVSSIPFEAISDSKQLNSMMGAILKWMSE
ncbi:MAG: hypothetical protein NC097_00420 [Clostridium sp.]|nr:xanthan lyase [Prevotella sp.]MCM1428246.1 hypothetical protein [Clostridium sp.]